jgi:hypothetical protein
VESEIRAQFLSNVASRRIASGDVQRPAEPPQAATRNARPNRRKPQRTVEARTYGISRPRGFECQHFVSHLSGARKIERMRVAAMPSSRQNGARVRLAAVAVASIARHA